MGLFAGYTRVSRVGDRDETLISPELQSERIRQYATTRGLDVELLRPELDVSGGKIERPILDTVIQGVEHGRYAGVIVADIDRLSRMNLVDALHVIQRIEDAGGQVIAVAQNFDASTPEGEWARNIWLSTANMMLKRYGAQFRQAKQSAVERGVWPIARAPLGYTVTRRKTGGDGKLRPDPATRDTIVRAFEARAAGKPWREVAEILGNGISGANKIVSNRAYLGEIRYGEFVNLSAHEPLVSRALWEAAQLEHPRPPRGVHPRALLTSIVRCAGCQGSMTPNSSMKGKYLERIYRCVSYSKAGGRCQAPTIISQRKLDAYVTTVALAEIARLRISSRERTVSLDRLQGELTKAEAELREYLEFTKIADVGAEALTAGARARETTVEEARTRVAEAWTAAPETADVAPGQTLGELWDDLSVDEQSHVLRGALGAIWVRRGSGPARDRVRIIAKGFEPVRKGRGRIELAPLDWVDDLPGEVRLSEAEHVA